MRTLSCQMPPGPVVLVFELSIVASEGFYHRQKMLAVGE